jgi:molybdopterin-binding protein
VPRPKAPEPELGLADFVCLALVCSGYRHGWGIVKELAVDGPLGRIWTLSRPLTYRAIDRLLMAELLKITGTEPGRGRDRRVLAPTRAGGRRADQWLDTPVTHLRDLRTELLLKLDLRGRAERPMEPFLAAQRETLAPILDRLERADTTDDAVAVWRREQARAVRRFLDALTALRASESLERAPEAEGAETDGLRLSARNQLGATVTEVRLGDQVVTVTAAVDEGEHMSAVVTRAALDDLDLVEGDRVVMISKAADTVVGVRRGARR